LPEDFFLHEQSERCRIAVEEILFADRADLTVAEKTGHANVTKLLLNSVKERIRENENSVKQEKQKARNRA